MTGFEVNAWLDYFEKKAGEVGEHRMAVAIGRCLLECPFMPEKAQIESRIPPATSERTRCSLCAASEGFIRVEVEDVELAKKYQAVKKCRHSGVA